MAEKSWHMKRRTFLRGIGGIAIGLPFLEAMGKDVGKQNEVIKRCCFSYMGNGVGNPQKDQKGYSEGYHWFPFQAGKDFSFTKSIEPYKPLREKLTVMGGLWNKNSSLRHAHQCADLWLTGGQSGGRYDNELSVDQAYALEAQKYTRESSLTLSADGGIGPAGRLVTMSHNVHGTPITSHADPRKIFANFFTSPDAQNIKQKKINLDNKKRYVDRILGQANLLKRSLGRNDQVKMDEYLNSINDIEGKLERQEAWLDVPFKQFKTDELDLSINNTGDPQEYYRTMFDLIVLAFEIDLTRSITFTLSAEQGATSTNFPIKALEGVPNSHEITHNKTEEKFIMWGKYDRWMSEQVAYFLDKMNKAQDQNGSILDSTIVMNGSACSGTHNLKNNPLILAGGKHLGLKHGRYIQMKEGSLCNLYVTMLNQLGVPTEKFGDSDGEVTEILTA